MKKASRDLVHIVHNRFNQPAMTVQPGESFKVDTELCTGTWLKTLNDTYSDDKANGPNPTVCVVIEGILPGDMIAVEIIDIAVDPIGYTGFNGDANPLARHILNRDWGLTTRTVAIRDGFIDWNDKIKLPIKPMIGTLGTAPAQESLLNSKGGIHGGNMDAQEVTTGSTIYLQSFVPGALLHIGDVHAIQGDGEINMGGGIECRATVTLKVERKTRPEHMRWIRAEDQDYIMGIACASTVEESFHAAAREVLCWMVESYGFAEKEAYLLMGQLLQARCTQFVNPTRTYVCKMPKKYLLV